MSLILSEVLLYFSEASIVLDPVREMVTEGDEEAKRLCLRVNNSNIDIPVRFPDELRDGKVLCKTEVCSNETLVQTICGKTRVLFTP